MYCFRCGVEHSSKAAEISSCNILEEESTCRARVTRHTTAAKMVSKGIKNEEEGELAAKISTLTLEELESYALDEIERMELE